MRRQVARAVAAAVDGAVAAAVDGAVGSRRRPPWSPLPSPPPSGGDDDSNDGGRCRDCSRRRLLTAVAAAAVAGAASRRNIYDAPTHPGRGLEFATMPGRTTYSGTTVNTEVVLRESRAKPSWKWGASKCEKRWKKVDKVHKKIVKYQAKCEKGKWGASKCEKKIGAQLTKRGKYTGKIDKNCAEENRWLPCCSE